MKRRLLAALLAALAAVTLMGGCWDRRELENVGFIMALGLDPTEGKDLEVTMLIAVPRKLAGAEGGGGGGGGGDKAVSVTRVRAPALAEANTMANAYISRYVSLQHTKTVVINEEFIRQGHLPRILDSLVRVPELRRTAAIFVSRGRAGDLLENIKPGLEQSPNRYLELLALTDRFTGMTPREARIHELATQLENPGGTPLLNYVDLRPDTGNEGGGEEQGGTGGGDQGSQGQKAAGAPQPPAEARRLLPGLVPRQGGSNLDLVGAVAVRANQPAGELSGREMRVVNMVRGTFQRAAVSFPDPLIPGERVAMHLRRGATPQIRPYWADGRVAFDVVVPLEADLLGVQSQQNYLAEDLLPVLEESVAKHLTAETEAVFRRTQEWGTDVFGLGYKAARLFATYPEWRQYHWEQHYPQVQASFRYQVRFRRFGQQLVPHKPLEKETRPGPEPGT